MARLRKKSKAGSPTSQSSSTEEQGSDLFIMPKKRGRGRTRGLRVQKKLQESADGKLDVHIHPTKMVAVGPGRKDFITDLSVIVQQNARHNVYKWKQVPQSVKDKIVQDALKNWRLSDTALVRRAILEEGNRLYRNWRNRLHEHYLMYDTKEEALEHVPEDISDSDWNLLVDYFSSPAFEKMSKINKANRAKQQINHTCGQRSFQAVIYDTRDLVTGKEPDMQKLWQMTHKRANGEWVNEASKEVNDKVAEQIDEELRGLEDQGGEIATVEPDIIEAAFKSVIGRKSGLMPGCGPALRSASLLRILQLQEELDAQKREAEEARKQCNELRAKIIEVDSQLVEEQRK